MLDLIGWLSRAWSQDVDKLCQQCQAGENELAWDLTEYTTWFISHIHTCLKPDALETKPHVAVTAPEMRKVGQI